jgi:hypothetical protein
MPEYQVGDRVWFLSGKWPENLHDGVIVCVSDSHFVAKCPDTSYSAKWCQVIGLHQEPPRKPPTMDERDQCFRAGLLAGLLWGAVACVLTGLSCVFFN